MENYSKGETKEVEERPVFDLTEGTVCMRVSAGSKLRNLMGFAVTKMKDQGTRQMCWSGTGNAVTKTITCTEIMKRKFKGLHQITKIRYRRVEEYWEPKLEGLERLKVNKDIPAITILLSKDQLDKTEPGYQPPGPVEEFWKTIVQSDQDKKTAVKKHREQVKRHKKYVDDKIEKWGKHRGRGGGRDGGGGAGRGAGGNRGRGDGRNNGRGGGGNNGRGDGRNNGRGGGGNSGRGDGRDGGGNSGRWAGGNSGRKDNRMDTS